MSTDPAPARLRLLYRFSAWWVRQPESVVRHRAGIAALRRVVR